MSDFTCEMSLNFDRATIRSSRDECLFVSGQSQIAFNFKCVFTHEDWISPSDFGEPRLVERFDGVLEVDIGTYIANRNLSSELDQVHAFLAGDLRQRLTSREDILQAAVDLAIDKACEGLETLPVVHNVVHILCPITIIHYLEEDEDLDVESTILGSLETDEQCMVPTAESAVKNLKTMVIPVGSKENKCTVCLEEMNEGCVATALPCGHLFHGDCIRLWLRTGHYCPLCRYEMPTMAEDGSTVR